MYCELNLDLDILGLHSFRELRTYLVALLVLLNQYYPLTLSLDYHSPTIYDLNQ